MNPWEKDYEEDGPWNRDYEDSQPQDRATLQNLLTATTPTQIRQPRALGPDRAVTGVAGANVTPFDPNQLPGIQDPLIDLGRGVIDVGESVVGLTSMPTFGVTGKLLEKSTGYDPDFTREWLGEFYSPSRKQAQQEVGKAEGFLGTSKALLENPSIIGETITRSLPAVAGGGALGRGVARIAPKLGSIGAAAVGEGAVASGMAAEQFRGQNESGFLSPKQATLAATTGLTTALVGILGGKVGKYLGVDDVDTLLTKGASNPATSAASVGKLIKGAISEGVIEELPQTVLEQIQSNIATGKPWSEGVPEGAAQGLFAGLGMGAGANVVSPLMSGRSQSVLDEQDIIPPQFDAAAVERAAIEGGRGQRRLGLRIPDTGNVLSDPQAAQLADQALREAQSPIQVPGRTPAIDLLRNELLPPPLAQVPRTTATRTREAGETLVRPTVEGLKVEPGFERTAEDRLQERDRTGALEGRPEFTAEENAAISEAISEVESSGAAVSDALKKRFPAPPYREPRTPQQRKSKADMEAEMQRESGYYLDEPVNQSLPEPPPPKPREGTTLVNPATGRKIVKPTVLSNLQRSRLMKALERGADETTIRNIIRSPEPDIEGDSLRLDDTGVSRESVASMSPEQYYETSRQWASDAMAGNGLSVQVQAEVAALRDGNLAEWVAQRDKADAEAKTVRDEVRKNPASIGDPAVQKRYGGVAQKVQFFNEGIKVLEGKTPEPATTAELQRIADQGTSLSVGRKFSAKLEDEIQHKINAKLESADEGEPPAGRAEVIKELIQDADDPDTVASEFKKELQDFGVETGIYKPYTKAQLDSTTVTSGRKYDFKRGDKYYRFEGWGPLDVSLRQSNPTTEITIPSKAEVQTIVDQLQKDYPNSAPVVVVENYHELPDSAHQAAYRQGGNPVGITGAVSGGKVYIVSNNLESVEEARQIWLHEQAGHFATDKILGPKLEKFMEQVADSFADSELMTDTKSRYKNASKSRLGREFVARLAENPQAAPNLWNRIVAQFRAWLRDIGWVKQVSDNDIAVLLNRSLESLAKKAEGLANEDVSLSLKTAAQAAAERYPSEQPPSNQAAVQQPPTSGAAAAQQAGSQAATPPVPTAALDDVYKIFEPSPKAKTPLREKGARFIESIRTGFSSKFRPLNELAEDIAKTYGLSRRKDVAGIMEQLKGSQGKAEAEIYRFDRDVSSLVKGDEKDFNAYIFLRRSLDRLNQDLLDIQRAQAGQNVPKLNRRSVGNYTIPQLEAKLNALEQKIGAGKLAKFQQAADGYQAYLDQALRLQVESGRMSPQIYQAIKDGNEFYAPFKVMKYLEETALPEGSGRRIDTLADFTKAMEGIESPDFKLGDMLAAARQSILMSRILADKNMAMRHFAQLANYDFNEIFFKPLKAGQEAPKGMEPISVLENGEVKRFAVRPEVAEAVQIYGGTAADLFTRALANASIPFRAGATALNLPFQISNLLADTPRAALVSKYGVRGATDLVRYPLDFVQSLYSSIAGDVFGYDNKLFQDFLDSGVAGTTVQEYLTPEALKFKEPTSISKSKKLANTVLFTIPRFAQAIEQTSKVLGVKRAMRFEGAASGKELAQRIPEAITELRRFSGSPDFGRQGKWVDQYRLNLIYMFLNARIQGTIADVGRLAGRDGSKMAARTWFNMTAAVSIPTILLYALNNRDEYKEDYEKRPKQEKDNYWLIPKDSFIVNDDGERMRDYWRIPKREISKWTANLTESALNFAERKDPQAVKEFAQKMVEELTPVNISGDTLTERAESVLASLNPLIKAPLEFGTGRDFYRHRDIVPDRMQEASPEQQYMPRTAEAFKVLAEKMPDVMPEALRSPLILENLTKNATAGLLTQFLPRQPIEGRSRLENTPLLSRFQAVPYTDSEEVQKRIDELKREAADESLARFRAAEKLLADNKGKPLAEILQQAPKDIKLMEKISDLWLADRNGITAQERRILSLPVRQRAAYVADQLSQLDGPAKQAKMIELSRKRILTEGVFQELPNVMQ